MIFYFICKQNIWSKSIIKIRGEIPVENMYCGNEYVSEKNLNEFLEKEYLFENEEVEIN